MLTSIRTVFAKGIARWFLMGLIGLLIVSFAIFGIQDIFRGFRSHDLATIGDTKINVEQFQRQYNLQLQNLSRQLGQPVSPEQARALGVDKQLLGRFVTDAALDERARAYGISLPIEKVAGMVMEDPAFQAGTGRFNRDYFNAILRQNGLSEGAFFDEQRRVYRRTQLGEAIAGEPQLPQVLRAALDRYSAETRSIEFFTLGESALAPIPAPDEKSLAAFFEERKGEFRAPEFRKFTYVVLSPDDVAAKAGVTDVDAQADYDARKDRFSTPEKREVQQIAFPTLDEAKAAGARLASNAVTFDALMAERKLQAADVTLGTVTKDQMLDPKIADAAFALPLNQASDAIAGKLSNVIVRVVKIEPSVVTPFEQVKEDIKKSIALDRAARLILDIQGRIEDDRAGGSTLKEIASKFSLKLVEIAAADDKGNDPTGAPVEIPSQGNLLRSVFSTDAGTETDAIDAKEAGFIWYDVQAVTPARDRTLDEARAAVTAAYLAEQKTKALRARSDELLKDLKAGKTLEEVAKGVGSEVKQAWNLKRNETSQGLSSDAVTALFATQVNSFGSASGATPGERVIFRVTESLVPTFDPKSAAAEGLAKQLESQISQELLNQYVLRSQTDLGLTINQQLLKQATGGGN